MDRGSEFIDVVFRKYVLEQLHSIIVYTSPAYPQGNAINESSHRMLEHAIVARSSVDVSVEYATLVRDATLTCNAVPREALGRAPFFILTGWDLPLPGLHAYQTSPTEEVRCLTIREMRFQAMMKALLREDDFATDSQPSIAVDDVVLYRLTDYERQNHAGHPSSDSLRFCPLWSRPARVTSVKDMWNERAPLRQVPLQHLRLFKHNLPPALRQVALQSLQLERPRFAKHTSEFWADFDPGITSSVKPSAGVTSLRTAKRRREEALKTADLTHSSQGGD